MNIQKLVSEDRAVSPVIGVILMVAITVILAAVIGTFVLGLGDSIQTNPTATFDFEKDGTTLTVTHDGGDSIPASELSFAGEPVDSTATVTWGSDPVAGGVSADVTLNSSTSGEVRLVWTNPDSGDTSILATHTVS